MGEIASMMAVVEQMLHGRNDAIDLENVIGEIVQVSIQL